MRKVPVAAPALGGNEETYVLDALRSTWISSTGPYVDRFEREFADLCGTRAAVSVANGTVALHLALLALGVGPGDEVIVPSLTYVATANAVRYVGAEPVFVDVTASTWTLDPALVAQAITERTKCIIAVHLYGHPADMDALSEVAAPHGIRLIEDAAEAHGARYRRRPAGSLATIGTFSFYGNKILTSGEGGALTVDDPALEQRMRLLRGQGMDPERRYFFPVIGYNYRLTNVACAILCAQLERVDQILAARRAIFERYRAGLRDVPGIVGQPVAEWADPAPWLYSVTVDEKRFGCDRTELARHLEQAGIETRPFFVPIHELPPYQRDDPFELPVTSRLADAGLNLPTFVGLAHDAIDEICREIAKVQEELSHR